MSKHRRFEDGAGFTRHCWECSNATDWDGKDGWCAAYDMPVTRYDSPNNVCSVGASAGATTWRGRRTHE